MNLQKSRKHRPKGLSMKRTGKVPPKTKNKEKNQINLTLKDWFKMGCHSGQIVQCTADIYHD